jgi:hypothetical protein
MGAVFYPAQQPFNRERMIAFHRGCGGVSDPDEKEAALARTGVIWTIVGVLLIIALLIYIL